MYDKDPTQDSSGAEVGGEARVVRAAAVVLPVVLAGALVAVVAGGLRLVLPPLELPATGTRIVRAVGVLVTAGGISALLGLRPALLAGHTRGADPTGGALRTVALLMGALAVVALLSNPVSAGPEMPGAAPTRTAAPLPEPEPAQPGGVVRRIPPSRGQAGVTGRGDRTATSVAGEVVPMGSVEEPARTSLLQRVSRYLPMALLLAVLALVWLVVTGRLRRPPPEFVFNLPLDPVHAVAGIEASLDEIGRVASDARDPITAAYQRLLAALEQAGAPRRPFEAPHEHLYRTLGPLGVPPDPMHRLTELYVAAQFGGHPVTDAHRRAAADALRTSLEGIRAAPGAAP